MHWLIAQQEPIQPGAEEDWIDELMRNRWRTLLSVDDMIEGIVTALEDTGVLDNTWIFCETRPLVTVFSRPFEPVVVSARQLLSAVVSADPGRAAAGEREPGRGGGAGGGGRGALAAVLDGDGLQLPRHVLAAGLRAAVRDRAAAEGEPLPVPAPRPHDTGAACDSREGAPTVADNRSVECSLWR